MFLPYLWPLLDHRSILCLSIRRSSGDLVFRLPIPFLRLVYGCAILHFLFIDCFFPRPNKNTTTTTTTPINTTMGSDIKQASFSPEYNESSQFDHNERHPGPSRALEAGRMGLSILALASAIGILATSAHNLKIYNDTHVANDFLLPLWPFEFNLGPSIALVACGSIMIVAAAASLVAGKIPSVCPPPRPPSYQPPTNSP